MLKTGSITKLTLLQVILKDFAHKYTEQLQILEKLFEEYFFWQNTSRWLFLSFKCQALRAVFSHPEKDSPRSLCLYLTAKKYRMRTKT